MDKDINNDVEVIKNFFDQDSYILDYVRKDTQKTRDVIADVYDYEIDGNCIFATLNSSSAGNMKADILAEALEKFGFTEKLNDYRRIDLYTTDSEQKLIPLSSLGEKYD